MYLFDVARTIGSVKNPPKCFTVLAFIFGTVEYLNFKIMKVCFSIRFRHIQDSFRLGKRVFFSSASVLV